MNAPSPTNHKGPPGPLPSSWPSKLWSCARNQYHSGWAKAKGGKKNLPKEEEWCCMSLCIFQLKRGKGSAQKIIKRKAFWVVVTMHYAKNKPTSGLEQAARSLEPKWGNLKANTGKFVGYYEHIKGLQQERTNTRRHHHRRRRPIAF